ncbi:hypothetical protein BH24GEM1_BH24GEM1_09670 [soil metagenome]
MAESDGRVVSNFIVQALRDEPLTIYGEEQQTRSFCYVEDDPTQRRPDTARAERLLGWRPTVALRERLGRTIP